jgi:hypothetical protein
MSTVCFVSGFRDIGLWVFGTALLYIFLVKWFHLYALRSMKKGGVVRAPKEMLHKL